MNKVNKKTYAIAAVAALVAISALTYWAVRPSRHDAVPLPAGPETVSVPSVPEPPSAPDPSQAEPSAADIAWLKAHMAQMQGPRSGELSRAEIDADSEKVLSDYENAQPGGTDVWMKEDGYCGSNPQISYKADIAYCHSAFRRMETPSERCDSDAGRDSASTSSNWPVVGAVPSTYFWKHHYDASLSACFAYWGVSAVWGSSGNPTTQRLLYLTDVDTNAMVGSAWESSTGGSPYVTGGCSIGGNGCGSMDEFSQAASHYLSD